MEWVSTGVTSCGDERQLPPTAVRGSFPVFVQVEVGALGANVDVGTNTGPQRGPLCGSKSRPHELDGELFLGQPAEDAQAVEEWTQCGPVGDQRLPVDGELLLRQARVQRSRPEAALTPGSSFPG